MLLNIISQNLNIVFLKFQSLITFVKFIKFENFFDKNKIRK